MKENVKDPQLRDPAWVPSSPSVLPGGFFRGGLLIKFEASPPDLIEIPATAQKDTIVIVAVSL